MMHRRTAKSVRAIAVSVWTVVETKSVPVERVAGLAHRIAALALLPAETAPVMAEKVAEHARETAASARQNAVIGIVTTTKAKPVAPKTAENWLLSAEMVRVLQEKHAGPAQRIAEHAPQRKCVEIRSAMEKKPAQPAHRIAEHAAENAEMAFAAKQRMPPVVLMIVISTIHDVEMEHAMAWKISKIARKTAAHYRSVVTRNVITANNVLIAPKIVVVLVTRNSAKEMVARKNSGRTARPVPVTAVPVHSSAATTNAITARRVNLVRMIAAHVPAPLPQNQLPHLCI